MHQGCLPEPPVCWALWSCYHSNSGTSSSGISLRVSPVPLRCCYHSAPTVWEKKQNKQKTLYCSCTIVTYFVYQHFITTTTYNKAKIHFNSLCVFSAHLANCTFGSKIPAGVLSSWLFWLTFLSFGSEGSLAREVRPTLTMLRNSSSLNSSVRPSISPSLERQLSTTSSATCRWDEHECVTDGHIRTIIYTIFKNEQIR